MITTSPLRLGQLALTLTIKEVAKQQPDVLPFRGD